MCCGKGNPDGKICACDVQYTGGKLTCNGEVIPNCTSMNDVVKTMMKMFCKPVVLYTVEKAPGGGTVAPAVMGSTSYTVPSDDLGGEYEIDYTFDVGIVLDDDLHSASGNVQAYRTPVGGAAAAVDPDTRREFNMSLVASVDTDTLKYTGRYFISKVALATGETIDIRGMKGTAGMTYTQAVCKITKIKHNS